MQAQIDYAGRSARWKYPDLWYTFTANIAGGATIQFVLIDTVVLAGNSDVRDPTSGEVLKELRGDELPGPEDEERAQSQMQWLEQTLRSSNASFLVVAGHYPVYSICEHGPTSSLISSVKPLLDRCSSLHAPLSHAFSLISPHWTSRASQRLWTAGHAPRVTARHAPTKLPCLTSCHRHLTPPQHPPRPTPPSPNDLHMTAQ